MGKMLRVVVALAAALMSVLGVATSSAPAVTWHNTGGTTAFTTWMDATSYTSSGVTLSCPNLMGTATLPTTTVTPTLTMTFTVTTGSGCTVGGISASVGCTQKFTGEDGIGLITGVMHSTCSVYESGTKVCHLQGTQSSYYINGPADTTGFVFTVTPGTLFSAPVGGACPLGSNEQVAASHTKIHFLGGVPRITRTA